MANIRLRPPHSLILWLSLVGFLLAVLVMFVQDVAETEELWIWGVATLMIVSVAFMARELVSLMRINRRFRLLGELAAKVNQAVLMNSDTRAIFTTILDDAFRILENVDHGSVLTFVEPDVLAVTASRGFDEDFLKTFRLPLIDTWQYQQTKGNITDALIIDPTVIRESNFVGDKSGWTERSVMSAPLFIGERLYGLINIDSRGSKVFRAEDLEVMRWFRAQIEVGLLARQQFETSLEELKIDGLTRVLSRVAFEEAFAEELSHAGATSRRLTLGMFDADGLKVINDAQGHQAGDTLLRLMADALRGATRASDLLGRYGGDEFIALFHRTEVDTMVGRTRQVLLGLADRGISFSFGFAQFPDDGTQLDDLIAVADKRLYQMKASRTLPLG